MPMESLCPATVPQRRGFVVKPLPLRNGKAMPVRPPLADFQIEPKVQIAQAVSVFSDSRTSVSEVTVARVRWLERPLP